MEYTVASSTVFKQGVGAKGPWTIYKLTLQGDPQEPTGFDQVQPGDKVTLETVQNGQYTNLNYKKVKPVQAAPAATGAPAGSSDQRVLKLLLLIAEQMGIDKEKQLEVLGG